MQSTNDMQSTDYRLLSVGEVIQLGDEWWNHTGRRWIEEVDDIGEAIKPNVTPYRRRTTLRDELESLLGVLVRDGYKAQYELQSIIARNYLTQEPQP